MAGAGANADETRSGSGADTGGHEELVFALCHEIGNLVGAIRLNAHLIDEEASALDLARAAVEIDDSASRIRSLLALVRPLLGASAAGPVSARPDALLDGLRDALEEYGGRGVGIEVAGASALPAVAGRQDVLHHLLVSFACYAVEEARPRGRVRITAHSDAPGRVTFEVDDDGPPDDTLNDFPTTGRTGRPLLCRIAHTLLHPGAGAVTATRERDHTRITLALPSHQD